MGKVGQMVMVPGFWLIRCFDKRQCNVLMNKPRIVSVKKDEWFDLVTAEVTAAVRESVESNDGCSLMLTGGNTAKGLYDCWASAGILANFSIRYYFGDERCVPPGHPESNHGMTMQSLFGAGLPDQCQLFRMEGESSNVSEAARRYQKVLPDRIDVLLLSVGEDGHIASLFPNHPALFESSRKVLAIVGPKPPYERLTIASRVIVSAKTVFVFARGRRKGAVLAEALKDPADVSSLPVRLTVDGTWIMDHEAVSGFKAVMEGNAARL